MPAAADPSTAFALLDRRIQEWIWSEQWTELRDIQEAAIPVVLEGRSDALIASPTASGKTEAAFLPIASAVASEAHTRLSVLYVSPLKALINDQQPRLERLFASIDAPAHPWHGDVSQSIKSRLRRSPRGVLLITPESLEAMCIRRGHELRRIVQHLRYVVIDEIHAFIGTERGRQVQSLLRRVEVVAERRIPRIALSATIGDLQTAARYLRPGDGDSVRVIESAQFEQEVRLQTHGYRTRLPRPEASEGPAGSDHDSIEAEHGISDRLHATLRGGRHLVFANSRARVEEISDRLRHRSQADGVANEFYPHHGSLDRSVRETAEARLREGGEPATLIVTTTLELGIDVGSVESIGQVGPPPSVTALRQRLGRSGRRGGPAVVRIHLPERELEHTTAPQDRIRSGLVQSIAVVELLRRGWYEPPHGGALHLSTLVQQTLSSVAQYGGIRAEQAWRLLCANGPFRNVDSGAFASLLKALADQELLTQTHDGLLVLDAKGERLVNHYQFYAAFWSPKEFRIIHRAETLGSMPILHPLQSGDLLIFAGRRWEIEDVDRRRKLIEVSAADGGRIPTFGGSGLPVHSAIREEMRHVYEVDSVPPYLDRTAAELLSEGRAEFSSMRLGERSVIEVGRDALIFPWTGTLEQYTLALLLGDRGLKTCVEGLSIAVADAGAGEIERALQKLCGSEPPSAEDLAERVENKIFKKHHRWLTEDLLTRDYASSRIHVAGALDAARRTLSMSQGS